MRNIDIRAVAKEVGIRSWEIGDVMGICDSGFSRKLRKELSGNEKQSIFGAIEMIKGARK